ncbi:hypothetical protein FOZ62_011962 [Perkinsus olseni]|uniref:Uncharacterized protein n=1 Tax=Perkinsus olseni TaxID=32597 RepID=A0A7J6R8I3_PEROL|nr:hypothetical protein FOZ62_011962 [Perkinsus olseni]
MAKALVCIKRVVDYAVKVRVMASKAGVDIANVKHSVNPFCEIAVEEALRMKEAGRLSEVVAVCAGPDKYYWDAACCRVCPPWDSFQCELISRTLLVGQLRMRWLTVG